MVYLATDHDGDSDAEDNVVAKCLAVLAPWTISEELTSAILGLEGRFSWRFLRVEAYCGEETSFCEARVEARDARRVKPSTAQ